MHKYQPRFHIIRCSEIARIWTHKWKTFQFSEMEFIAVTAYQNEKVKNWTIQSFGTFYAITLEQDFIKNTLDYTIENQSQSICKRISRHWLWKTRKKVMISWSKVLRHTGSNKLWPNQHFHSNHSWPIKCDFEAFWPFSGENYLGK